MIPSFYNSGEGVANAFVNGKLQATDAIKGLLVIVNTALLLIDFYGFLEIFFGSSSISSPLPGIAPVVIGSSVLIVQFDRLSKVDQGLGTVATAEIGQASIVVGFGIAAIERDGPIEIGDRLGPVLHFPMDSPPIIVGNGIVGVELERPIEVRERTGPIALLGLGIAPIVIGRSVVRVDLDSGIVVGDRPQLVVLLIFGQPRLHEFVGPIGACGADRSSFIAFFASKGGHGPAQRYRQPEETPTHYPHLASPKSRFARLVTVGAIEKCPGIFP
jgi:hypothetical protein